MTVPTTDDSQVTRNFQDRLARFEDGAERAYATATSWADFSNALFAPGTGLAATLFPARDERARLLVTPEWDRIHRMLGRLIDRFGLVEGATPKDTAVVASRSHDEESISVPLDADGRVDVYLRRGSNDPKDEMYRCAVMEFVQLGMQTSILHLDAAGLRMIASFLSDYAATLATPED